MLQSLFYGLIEIFQVQSLEIEGGLIGILVSLFIISLILSGVFSGSEVAFFSIAGQPHLLENAKEHPSDQIIKRMIGKPRRLLATILIGNTVSNIVASVVAAVLTGEFMFLFGFSEFFIYAVEVVLLTFLILVLSEITPKIIAINNPVTACRRFSYFIYFWYILLAPFSKAIAKTAMNLESRLPKPANKMTSHDIRTMAEVGEKDGSIKEDEREIIENVIEFGTISVKEAMTSRVNIVAISMDDKLSDVLALITDKGYSRMPLYQGELDNIVGIVYAKDLLPYIGSGEDSSLINWKTLARKTLFIPPSKKLDDLLRDFQQEKTHMAIVVDEYGGTEGLITMDDILEEIVGDLADETDDGEQQFYKKFSNGVFLFDAGANLDDVEEIMECSISSEDDEFETLGGLIYHLSERLPTVGEKFNYKDVELTVHSVENNRIKKVRVKLLSAVAIKKEQHKK